MPRLNVLGLCCLAHVGLLLRTATAHLVVYLRDGKMLEFGDSVPILA